MNKDVHSVTGTLLLPPFVGQ